MLVHAKFGFKVVLPDDVAIPGDYLDGGVTRRDHGLPFIYERPIVAVVLTINIKA
jgi:hypothetical protein